MVKHVELMTTELFFGLYVLGENHVQWHEVDHHRVHVTASKPRNGPTNVRSLSREHEAITGTRETRHRGDCNGLQ